MLLASVADPNATSYHHPAVGDAYYYLQVNHDCPGLNSIPSDTMNNLPPAVTTLEKVTVQSDGVLVTWYDNMDQKTVAYIIYRSTEQGTMPIDTVFGALQYLDQTAMANARSENYYVLAMDQCGNTGTFDMPHQTIHLTTEVNFCDQYIELNWNNYTGWQNGRENVQIWLGLDGAPLVFEHQVQLSDTLAYITGIDDNREYCIAIVSKENGRDVRSFSNTVCVFSDVITPVDRLEIRNVTVNMAGEIEILWDLNSDADISELYINRGLKNSSLALWEDLSSNLPSSDMVVSVDRAASTQDEVYYYQLETVDNCGTNTTSNEFYSLLLRANSSVPGENQLSWSPFDAQNRTLVGYQLCRIEADGTETSIYESSSGPLNYQDFVSPTDGLDLCYVIKATHMNSSNTDTLVARSNIACLKPQVGLYIPNAFVPAGQNSIFQVYPTVASSLQNFSMQIFNRWGGRVFESRDVNYGWDGNQDGKPLNPGVFFYLVSYDQPDGKSEKRTGTVHLIR